MKAIVFDWDLTLWNSWDIHVWLMHRTADALGVPRPQVATIAREFSRPFFQHLAWFFSSDRQMVADVYLGFYQEVVSQMGHLFPNKSVRGGEQRAERNYSNSARCVLVAFSRLGTYPIT